MFLQSIENLSTSKTSQFLYKIKTGSTRVFFLVFVLQENLLTGLDGITKKRAASEFIVLRCDFLPQKRGKTRDYHQFDCVRQDSLHSE